MFIIKDWILFAFLLCSNLCCKDYKSLDRLETPFSTRNVLWLLWFLPKFLTPNEAKKNRAQLNSADRMMRWWCVRSYQGAPSQYFLKYGKCLIFSSNFLILKFFHHKWRGRGGMANGGQVSLSSDLMATNQSSVLPHLTRSPPTRAQYYLQRMPGWFWQIEQTKFSSDSNTWEKIFMLNLLHLSFITFS